MRRLGRWPELIGGIVSLGLLAAGLFWWRPAAIPSWLILGATLLYRLWSSTHGQQQPADAPMRLDVAVHLEYPAGGDVQDAIRQALVGYLQSLFASKTGV